MPRTCSIPLHRDGRYLRAVDRVLDRGILTEGPETDRLEEEFATWLGVERDRVVAVSSGTSALTALLRAHGIGPVDYVAVPAFTFTATALAVLRAGATPYFVDVDETWSMDPHLLSVAVKNEPKIKAAIGVDLHGVPAAWSAIEEAVPDDFFLIEDACPAYGAFYERRLAGTLGRSGAAFSLNESKQLPAGEGGIVVAPEGGAIADIVRALRCFGEYGQNASGPLGDRLRSSLLAGDNWKITEVAAAFATVGLDGLDHRVELGRRNGDVFRAAAQESGALKPHPFPYGAVPSWFKVRLEAPTRADAAANARWLSDRGVPIRAGDVKPLVEHPVFEGCPRGPIIRAYDAEKTIIIGSRAKPVFGISEAEADDLAQVVISLPSEVSP